MSMPVPPRSARHLQLRTSRLALAASLALGALAATGAAQAQTAPPAPVPENIDANGVDLFTGKLAVTGPALTLGSDGSSLSYYRWNKGAGWSDNVMAFLNQSGSTMTVGIGGSSDGFIGLGSTFSSTEGNRSTLTLSNDIYTYTAGDGTVARFDAVRANELAPFSNEGMVTEIVSTSSTGSSPRTCRTVRPWRPTPATSFTTMTCSATRSTPASAAPRAKG